MSEYIEFEVNDTDRFESLEKVFSVIKVDKGNDSFKTDDAYLDFFDESAKSYFGWYSDHENNEFERKWFSSPVESRRNDPNLKRKWIFGSMIDAIRSCDYELISCEVFSNNLGRLNFSPWGHPYGGTESLEALIESFGFKIVNISDSSI